MKMAAIAMVPILFIAPPMVDQHKQKTDPLEAAMDYHVALREVIAEQERLDRLAAERAREAAAAARAAERAEPPAGDISVAGLPDPWDDLAACESGGNPAAVNPAGPYYGLFQFLQSTWESVGGVGLPSQASVAEQLKRAQILQARSGWGQWPVCAAGF